jgi:hypothetical protein
MPLAERQAACLSEQFAQENRLVIDLEIVGFHELHEGFVANIGPGRRQREIVVDGSGHKGSGNL